jgi:exonuclease SbcC
VSERVDIQCPHCQHVLHVRTEYLGQKLVCKYCEKKFRTLPEAAPGKTPAAPTITSNEDAGRVTVLEEELRQVRTELTARDQEMHAEQARLQAQVQILQRQLEAARDWQKETANLQTQLNEMRFENDRLQQAAAAAAQELAAVRAERDQMVEERQQHQARLEAAWADTEHLGQLAEELDSVRAARDELNRQRQTVAQEAEHLHARVAELENALESGSQRETELRSQVEGWQTRLQEREAQDAAALSQHREAVSRHEAEMEQLRREADGLRQERDAWRGEREAWSHEREQMLARQQEEANAHGQAVQQVQAQVERLHGEVAGLRQERDTLAGEHGALRAEHEGLSARHAELGAAHEGRQSDVERLGQEIAGGQQERDALRGQLESLNRERDQLLAEREAPAAAREQARQLEAELSRLQGVVEQARQREEATGRSNLDLVSQNQALQARLEHLAAAPKPVEDAVALRRQFEQEKAALVKQLEWVRRDLETARQTLYNLGIEV